MPVLPAIITKPELVTVRQIIAQISLHVVITQLATTIYRQTIVNPLSGDEFNIGCSNFVIGNDNLQSLKCDRIGHFGCSNLAIGDENSQTIHCKDIGEFACRNYAQGDGNTQTIDCSSVEGLGCTVDAFGEDFGSVKDNTETNAATDVGFLGCFVRAIGNDNKQNMDCKNTGECAAGAQGNDNSQKVNCNNVRGFGCNVQAEVMIIIRAKDAQTLDFQVALPI